MSNTLERLLNQLEKRQENGSLRTLKHLTGLVDFSSNDYLGLANDQQLARIIWSGQRQMKLSNGSGGSRLLTGNSQLTEELEQFLAAHFKGERALIFNSGYSANLAVMAAIPQRGDTIIYDSSIHACIKEGSRLSNAKYHAFRHNDVNDLENKLRSVEGTAMVVIESVYSMDGDWAELEDIVEACDRYQADLIIDEAHTTGWCGPHGEGWVCAENLQDRFLARVYTFGKALGHHGACVVGSEVLINYLINFARPFIYTTALPDTAILSIDCAWKYIMDHPQLAEKLKANIELYGELRGNQMAGVNDHSPIQQIPVKGNKQARLFSDILHKQGFDIRPILSPTVKAGEERLRVNLHSFNTAKQIESLSEVIVNLLK